MLHLLVLQQRVQAISLYLASFVGAALAAVHDNLAAELPQVADAMQRCVGDGRVSGAVTLVAHNGKIVHLGAVGLADIAQERPMTTDALFAIASMTKPITSTAVMILQDEGKLSIDDPVSKYLPKFADAKLKSGESVGPITIKQLLTHTSGLVGSQACEDSLKQTADELAARPFGFRPGEKWEYSPGMNVCGRIVEVASGQGFAEFIQARILDPVGMTSTTFYLTENERQRVATLYSRGPDDEGPLKPSDRTFARGRPGDAPSPSGGLFSTAEDMFRFYQMILSGGQIDGQRVVSAESVAAMTQPQTGDLRTGFTPGNAWGLGWCVVREPQGVSGMLSPGTFGHGGAFGTQGWVDPVRKAIFVLMIQRAGLPNSDDSDIRREFQQAAVDALDGGSAR